MNVLAEAKLEKRLPSYLRRKLHEGDVSGDTYSTHRIGAHLAGQEWKAVAAYPRLALESKYLLGRYKAGKKHRLISRKKLEARQNLRVVKSCLEKLSPELLTRARDQARDRAADLKIWEHNARRTPVQSERMKRAKAGLLHQAYLARFLRRTQGFMFDDKLKGKRIHPQDRRVTSSIRAEINDFRSRYKDRPIIDFRRKTADWKAGGLN